MTLTDILSSIAIIGTIGTVSLQSYTPILKDACDVTDTYIESVEFNRKQAENYGYKDVYVIDKVQLEKHNNLCKEIRSGSGLNISDNQ